MKWIFVIFMFCCCCVRQPRLPENSPYNVTAQHNDSTWFCTAKALRLYHTGSPEVVRQFNLRIATDIPFPGHDLPKIPDYTANGCTEDCRPSQSLTFYNIPLKRGRFKIGKLDKRRTIDNEREGYWLIGYSGGAYKWYKYEGRKPGWIRITSYDKKSNVVEGRFAISLDEDLSLHSRLVNEIPPIAKFSEGLFRVKLTDVKLK